MSDALQVCFEKLTKLLDIVRPILLVSGVPEKRLTIDVERKKLKTLVDAFDWLHDLSMSYEFEQAVKVRALVTEEVWQRYGTLGIEGLQEQILWKRAKENLLKRWRNKRPNIFGRLRCRKRKSQGGKNQKQSSSVK
jgi:hypothetical protein